ncbi:unnamed protein product, partial [Brassica rapa subsp. narinosa]
KLKEAKKKKSRNIKKGYLPKKRKGIKEGSRKQKEEEKKCD